MLIDTYNSWVIRHIESNKFVMDGDKLYLMSRIKAESYANIGYEAIEVVVDIKLKSENVWDYLEDATLQQMEGRV